MQITFILFTFLYAGWQTLYEGSIMYSIHSIPSSASCFSPVWMEHTSSTQLNTCFTKWIDHYQKGYSFLFIPIDDSKQLLIGIGKHSTDILSSIPLESSVAYIVNDNLQQYDGKQLNIHSQRTRDELVFSVKTSPKKISRTVIGKGVEELENTFLLFLDYETCSQYFPISYDELIKNFILLPETEEDTEQFCSEMETAGCQMVPQNWQTEIQSYFINQAKAGFLYAIFFFISGLFIFYSVYVKLLEFLKHYQKELSVYYLCGAPLSCLRLSLYLFLTAIILISFLTSSLLSFAGGLTQSREWVISFFLSLLFTFLFLLLCIRQIRIALSNSKIESSIYSE